MKPNPRLEPTVQTDAADLRIVEADFSDMDTIHRLNLVIFEEERIINSFEHEDLIMLLAYSGDEPVGFKIGYRESRWVYYSAKGGVLSEYRRLGVARRLLYDMIERVQDKGYARFAFDTFPNRHPGMAILAFTEGFRVTKADFNPTYRDFRLRFEIKL